MYTIYIFTYKHNINLIAHPIYFVFLHCFRCVCTVFLFLFESVVPHLITARVS
jgi:hypothetical protein